ncbi:MAG TPA: ergothioneine biosynthesis protein EgtB [Thermoanaerobaculia bacterium]|nr:ergothioneine biosynthesis protein EgtB [Thermoanaerobaculia bacterium]
MERQDLIARYRATRALSVALCSPLASEDYRVQSMPDVSPPWWNLGHTTWFFAKNILEPFGRYGAGDARFEYALNSYYESLGPRLARDHRGLVTRPTTAEIYRFRASVDERFGALVAEAGEADYPRLQFLALTGIQHEQQHQELLVTEIKHILGSNLPELREPYLPAAGGGTPPALAEREPDPAGRVAPSGPLPARPVAFAGGLFEFGNLEGGWCWDNEMPVHRAYLEPFVLLDRLVTNGEYLEFIEQGGYADPLLWLANGWARVQEAGWSAPLYWEREGGRWQLWTLGGRRALDVDEPVCHVSFYEADAYARWQARRGGASAGARLPTEREWEHAARVAGFPGPAPNFLESGSLHPRPFARPGAPAAQGPPAAAEDMGMAQLGGDVWEWTSSHYEPYPGYQPFDGNLMEYNGKFMDNQRVLRGGSCATPAAHIRPSYRNFWPADTRFQFTGIRLALPMA